MALVGGEKIDTKLFLVFSAINRTPSVSMEEVISTALAIVTNLISFPIKLWHCTIRIGEKSVGYGLC
jgi:hypothetical protein